MKKKIKITIKETYQRVAKDLYDNRYAIICFLIYYVLAHLLLDAFCPLVIVTGFPCPGCGMTRAVQFLFMGQFARSFRAHPLGLPVVLVGIYFFWQRYVRGKNVKYFQTIILILLLLLIVVYLVRMKTIFPYRPPMSYTRGNFFEKVFPLYRPLLRNLFDIW